MARTRDERRLANLAAGQAMADPCACGHARDLHQDEWSDALLVGEGACNAWVDHRAALTETLIVATLCPCRSGDYPRAEDEVNDRRAEGAW